MTLSCSPWRSSKSSTTPPNTALRIRSCEFPQTVPGSHAVLRIHNQGSYIPPAERNRVFTRFYRSPSVEHRAPGTGLGLSIAKKAVEAHGGKISIESDVQAGTTFVITIPAAAEELCMTTLGSVLIVEDDMALRQSLRSTLEAAGFCPGEASSGEEAALALHRIRSRRFCLMSTCPASAAWRPAGAYDKCIRSSRFLCLRYAMRKRIKSRRWTREQTTTSPSLSSFWN